MANLNALYRPFPQEKVHWRAQHLTKDGKKALALAYIDARDVMALLDAVVGPENWQRRYPIANSKTCCEIGIRINGEWIWKADGAGDTDVEAEKGAFSDAFKRAAVSWGIARYLYDLGQTWVPCETWTDAQGKRRFSKFLADPWSCVDGNSPMKGKITKLKAKVTDFMNEVKSCSDADQLNGLIVSHVDILENCRIYLPDSWYDRVQEVIHERTAELNPLAAG